MNEIPAMGEIIISSKHKLVKLTEARINSRVALMRVIIVPRDMIRAIYYG